MKPFDRNRTLQELEGADWGEPDFHSSVVINVHRLRRVPLKDFLIEDMRLMISQQVGLSYVVPLAIEQLTDDPLAEGDFYAGDLLCAVLRISDTFWRQHPAWRQQVFTLITQAIDRLRTLKDWERDSLEDQLRDGLHRLTG
jgi:hypothetical protein